MWGKGPKKGLCMTSPVQPIIQPLDVCELPTKGVFYPAGSPLYDTDRVEFRDMTSEEEDLLANKVLLRKGLVFDKLFKNVLTNKNIEPEKMTIVDRKALMIRVRINSYGPEYKVDLSCPKCGRQQTIAADLQKAYDESTAKIKDLEDNMNFFHVERVSNDNFAFVLPKTGKKVQIRILTGEDEHKMLKRAENKKKAFKGADVLEEKVFTELLESLVVSFDGVTDPAVVNTFCRTLPAMDSQKIREVYYFISCNFKLMTDFECEDYDCGHTGKVELPLTADLFRFDAER